MLNIKCLIIDDEPVGRKLLKEFIGELNFPELVAKRGVGHYAWLRQPF
jgi:hypothetical protein